MGFFYEQATSTFQWSQSTLESLDLLAPNDLVVEIGGAYTYYCYVLANFDPMRAKELEAECWTAVAAAVQRWDGSKGKLSSWVYTTVSGRMKDLRKQLVSQKYSQLNLEVPLMENAFLTATNP